MSEQVGVAVLGLGTIGGEVARTIVADDRLRLVAALARRLESANRAGIDPSLFGVDGAAIVDNPDVQVVVEVLGGEQPAADLMIRALANGKHVVTANKEAVSKNLPAILAAARDGDAAFLCEASVGGGIPLFVSLKQIMETNRIERIRGIVNGTTNYILWKMETEGTAYADALAQAQELGYAEPDPTADVEGFDSSYKLAILASLISGRHVRPEEIDRTGISTVTAEDIEEAKLKGGTVRLIASAERAGDNLLLRVAPTFVSGDDLFSLVSANYNAVEIVGDNVGPVMLHGQGAGPKPTASAILSDVFEAIRSGSAATPKVML
ncbi:MAG: homoserine dehydrogenase [Chloroflexia bacterium]|nr:homoserine dehydrogenase [Chloroflexia bacterium]